MSLLMYEESLFQKVDNLRGSPGAGKRFSLEALTHLVFLFVPRKAVSINILKANTWGPAHELGHALIATRRERSMKHYGMGSILEMVARSSRSHQQLLTYTQVCEAAAMKISFQLHRLCGRPDLIATESRYTEDEYLKFLNHPSVPKLLARRGCDQLPRSIVGLGRLCLARGLQPNLEPIRWFNFSPDTKHLSRMIQSFKTTDNLLDYAGNRSPTDLVITDTPF